MVGPLEMETDSSISTGETRHDQAKLKGRGNDGTSGKCRNVRLFFFALFNFSASFGMRIMTRSLVEGQDNNSITI